MIIPVYVDEKKDAELVRWLSEQTNRSAYVRFVLYEKMKRNGEFSDISGNYFKNSENILKKEEKNIEIKDDFMKCIGNL